MKCSIPFCKLSKCKQPNFLPFQVPIIHFFCLEFMQNIAHFSIANFKALFSPTKTWISINKLVFFLQIRRKKDAITFHRFSMYILVTHDGCLIRLLHIHDFVHFHVWSPKKIKLVKLVRKIYLLFNLFPTFLGTLLLFQSI